MRRATAAVAIRVSCVLVVMAAASFIAPAWARCDRDSIETISEDGDLIILASGDKYDVAPSDEATAADWQEGDDVLVCGDTIIDRDRHGERVEVTAH
jgi:hypothetical protein